MRIAILRRAPRASFSMDVYADGLVGGLRVARPDWKVIELSPTPIAGHRRFNLILGIRKYYERYWRYPSSLKKVDADIFHIIDHSDGYLTSWLNHFNRLKVITCHDLINLIQPETFKGRAAFPLISMTAWKLAIQGMIKAEHIISVSSHTANDIANCLSIDPSIITVVPNAVDPVFKPLPPDVTASFRIEQGLTSETFCLLNVGSNNARKNVSANLKITLALKTRGYPVHFWKVGADFSNEQKQFMQTHDLQSAVTYLGQPGIDRLIQIYSAADVLVAPSLYEGFGLTVLEAMACGTAVVTSDQTSLPEVAGDAAILVNPQDIEAIASAVVHLYEDSSYRQMLIQKGLQRVREFTWEKTAENVAQIYEKLAEKNSISTTSLA